MRDMVSVVKHAITLFAGVVLTLLVLPFIQTQPNNQPYVAPTPVPDVVIPVTLSEQEAIFGDLYDMVAPSVVSINLAVRIEEGAFFTSVSSGSGFFIDTEGHILTNAHVLQISSDVAQIIADQNLVIAETRAEIRMYDGTITSAEIIGIDLDSDLAVLQVDAEYTTMPALDFADSENLRVGQMVLAIGNPFSNDWTMTSGIISALNRSIRGLDGFSIGGVIQTDTAINPGNSGGPLVNLDGDVIGINSQINTASGVNVGIGFAVPSNLASKVAELLISQGEVEYSFIGIERQVVDLDLINAFDLPNNLRGVAVFSIFEDSPAAEAGLQAISNNSVDVITAIDGTPIADFDELLGYLALHTVPGDTVNLTVFRGGRTLEIPLTLGNRPTVNAEATEEPESTQEAEQEELSEDADN